MCSERARATWTLISPYIRAERMVLRVPRGEKQFSLEEQAFFERRRCFCRKHTSVSPSSCRYPCRHEDLRSLAVARRHATSRGANLSRRGCRELRLGNDRGA